MDNGAFEEIINFAKEKEQEAVDFYTDLAGNAEAANIKEVLLSMAEDEKKHREILEDITLEAFEGSEPPDIEDLKISSTLPEMEAKPDMNFQDILTVAIKREESAEKLYKHMAQVATDDNQKQVLERLALEELKHRNTFEKEYEDRVMQEN